MSYHVSYHGIRFGMRPTKAKMIGWSPQDVSHGGINKLAQDPLLLEELSNLAFSHKLEFKYPKLR